MSRLKILGENIAKYRKQKGLSQEKLAEAVDLSREYIVRIERGQKNISLRKLFMIADVLNADFCELVNFK